MKYLFNTVLFCFILFLVACVEEDSVTPEEKLDRNTTSIQSFLLSNSISDYDSTESGIYYLVENEGNGESPLIGDTVVVNYTTMSLGSSVEPSDIGNNYGDIIYSTYYNEDSVEMSVGQLINVPSTVTLGWIEALQLMQVGSRMVFFFPSELAYGVRGFPPFIGQDEVVVYDIELLEIKPAF